MFSTRKNGDKKSDWPAKNRGAFRKMLFTVVKNQQHREEIKALCKQWWLLYANQGYKLEFFMGEIQSISEGHM